MTILATILALATVAQTEGEVRELVQKFNAAYLADDLQIAHLHYNAKEMP